MTTLTAHLVVRTIMRCTPVTLLVVTSIGCQCGNRLGRVPPAFKHERESGIAVIGKDYTFTGNTTVHADKPVLFTLKSNESVTYDGKNIHPDFRAYVRPRENRLVTDEIHVNFTVPMIDIITGWAYLVGTSPMGKTTRVRAVGEGTKMIIEVDELMTPAVHRVYFVGDAGSKVQIFVPESATPQVYTMKSPGTYVEVYDNDGTLTWKYMGAYANVPARAEFVANVLKEIEGARIK